MRSRSPASWWLLLSITALSKNGFVLAQVDEEQEETFTNSNTSTTILNNTGAEDCPCIDSFFPPGTICNENGCYGEDYGASACALHDVLAEDPLCIGDSPPDYCSEEWCYVDVNQCKLSSEAVFASDIAPTSAGLHYSYSTCNSTVDAWKKHLTTKDIRGKYVDVVIPQISHPRHYKMTESGEVAASNSAEYYNDTIPWQGWIIDYLSAIADNTEIAGFNFTFRSGGSDLKYPSSAWSSSVNDVYSGLASTSVSSFWVTSERLELTPFTTFANLDKIYLWVPRPSVENDFLSNIQKVLLPFSPELWGMLAISITFVSFLSIWFATKESALRKWWQTFRSDGWRQGGLAKRARILFKLGVDSILANAAFFFGHTVDYDIYSSFASKILIFGYAFLILIAVASYTANLAAYLASSGVGDYVKSVEEAILKGSTICAHPVLADELNVVWPGAKFVFNRDSDDLVLGMLDYFDDGLCDLIVAGTSDILAISERKAGFCARDLVYTSSLVLEKAIAFPVNKDLAAGFSFFMYEAEQLGISYADFEESSRPPDVCNLELSDTLEVDTETPSLSVANFALPLTVFYICAVIAVCVHIYTMRIPKYKEQHRISSMGGVSETKLGRLGRLPSQRSVMKPHPDGDDQENGDGSPTTEFLKSDEEPGSLSTLDDLPPEKSQAFHEVVPTSPKKAIHFAGQSPGGAFIDPSGKVTDLDTGHRELDYNPNDIDRIISLMRQSEASGDRETKFEALVSLQEYQFNVIEELRLKDSSKKND